MSNAQEGRPSTGRSSSAPPVSKSIQRAAGWSALSLLAGCVCLACGASASSNPPGDLGMGGVPATPIGTGGATTTVPTAAPTATGPGVTNPAPTSTTAPTGTTVPPAPTGTTAPPAPTGTTAPPAPTGTTAPPPPDTTELTLTTTPFTLNPGEEAFKCQNMANTLGKDVAIVQARATMAKGSHHMFVFYDSSFNQDVPLTDCSGTEFHDFLILTQSPEETQNYPAGVGRLLKSGEGFRFGMHYLNTTSDPLQANVTAHFEYKDTTAVQHLAAQMELNQGILYVPPGESTQTHTFTVPYDISLIYAISHMHKQGVHFKATAGNQTLYETTIWDEPVATTYDPPLLVPANSTITYACDYHNDTGMTLSFGESAEKNEMCIFFGVFYATQASSPQGQGLDQLL